MSPQVVVQIGSLRSKVTTDTAGQRLAVNYFNVIL